jgi:hypothetical protein
MYITESPTKIKLKPKFWITKYSHHYGFSITWCRNGSRNPIYICVQLGRTVYSCIPFNYKIQWPSDSKWRVLNE